MHDYFQSFLTFEVKMIQNTNKSFFHMHFKNVFKSSKGALINEKKNILALSDITLFLVTLSSEQNRYYRKQTLSQSMVIFPKSSYEKKSIWFHFSLKRLKLSHVWIGWSFWSHLSIRTFFPEHYLTHLVI